MQSGVEALRSVKEKFPGKDENIESLFRHDEHFNELCLDYFLCRQNLKKHIEDEGEREAWLHEYKTLLINLENELAYFLTGVESLQ